MTADTAVTRIAMFDGKAQYAALKPELDEAALRVMAARKAEIHQGVEVFVCHRKNMATAATVATIRTTEFLVLFVPKRDAAGSAVSGRDINVGFVDEFHAVIIS